jgi:L-lactate dehydrogenase complex protein LldF
MRSAFHRRVRGALADQALQTALDRNADRRRAAWEEAFAGLPDAEAIRHRARRIRLQTLERLDAYLGQFIRNAEANGIVVHRAADAAEALSLVLGLCRSHNASLVAKSKSMVSQEIGLNSALEVAGIRVVETDLGEYVAQLREEPPSHIISPIVHLRKEDVAATLTRALGMPQTNDVEVMCRAARDALRQVFLSADVGITGVNFGVAETGTLCLVTNEGNGRMAGTLPPLHVALMGIERLVPTLEDLGVMLQVLPRAATGQSLTSYVSLFQGPRRSGEPDGPDERHLILIDNGRGRVLQSDLRESMACVRCGACLNACPVYREAGGHAYASVYQGPIGSVISPALFGVTRFGHLAKASTLCGACQEACPVGIDLPGMLLRVRRDYGRADGRQGIMRAGVRAYAWFAAGPARYRWAQRAAACLTRLLPHRDRWTTFLPPPLAGWTASRDFPRFASRPFRQRFAARPLPPRRIPDQQARTEPRAAPSGAGQPLDRIAQFERAFTSAGGQLIRVHATDIPKRVLEQVQEAGAGAVLAWSSESPMLGAVRERLQMAGIGLVPESTASRGELDRAVVGLTGAAAGLADTGTIVVASGPGQPMTASLVTPIHITLLLPEDIYPDLVSWLVGAGRHTIATSANITLITGPSRTADIEMTLTIGVHGPAKVVVLCVEPG